MEGRRADGQERPILFTQKHSHSTHYLCAMMLSVNIEVCACVCFVFLNTHFLLENANVANDKAPADSAQTKHVLSKAVHLYAESNQRNCCRGLYNRVDLA